MSSQCLLLRCPFLRKATVEILELAILQKIIQVPKLFQKVALTYKTKCLVHRVPDAGLMPESCVLEPFQNQPECVYDGAVHNMQILKRTGSMVIAQKKKKTRNIVKYIVTVIMPNRSYNLQCAELLMGYDARILRLLQFQMVMQRSQYVQLSQLTVRLIPIVMVITVISSLVMVTAFRLAMTTMRCVTVYNVS